MELEDLQVAFSIYNDDSMDLWMRLGGGKLLLYSDLKSWLHTHYQAHYVVLKPGHWLIQFPNPESYTRFTLTWM